MIGLLSSTLSTFVVLIAVYDAVLTLGPVLAGIWNQGYIAIVVLLWIPLVAMFILNQTSLSNIIRRAKWKTLNEIQARVEKLHAADNLAEEDTLEAINRLMDYHDRIKGTRNSALNARAVLSMLNSLLLPLLALLLANLDTILSLLR